MEVPTHHAGGLEAEPDGEAIGTDPGNPLNRRGHRLDQTAHHTEGGLTDLTDRITDLSDRRHRVAGRRGGVLHDPSHIPVRFEVLTPIRASTPPDPCGPSDLSSFTLIHSHWGM